MKRLSLNVWYELVLAGLVIVSLTLDLESTEGAVLDWTVWAIFFVDYMIRLMASDRKWRYFKEHPLDFIAILPFDQLLQSARIVRLFRVLRLIMILNRRFSFFDQVLRKYKIDSLVMMLVALLFLIALPMKMIEPSFETYDDALWWAIVTMTTVGYGDLSPETPIGRILASALMLMGIGMIGVITGTVAAIFTREKDESRPKAWVDLQQKLNEYPQLDDADYAYMHQKLEQLRESSREAGPTKEGARHDSRDHQA
ncbi:potassium channel family protein [Paenibacillus sp. PL2-23]|uniref:potassium channel family protein n=1 Tax=Paenibacillus sp. PL2-23 TaxID=2100729 RepID=UPI0030F80920